MASSTLVHAIDQTTYRQDGWAVHVAGLRLQSFLLRRFKFPSSHFVDIPIKRIVSCFLYTCTWYHLPSSMLLTSNKQARWPEWYEAMVYGHQSLRYRGFETHSCHLLTFLYNLLLPLFWTPAHGISFHHPWCNWPDNIQTGWRMAEWSYALI